MNRLITCIFFVSNVQELEAALDQFLPWLKKEGALWISWPKKTASIPSEVDKAGA